MKKRSSAMQFASIRIASVPHTNHVNHQRVVDDFVYDSESAQPNPVDIFEACQLSASRGAGRFGQSCDVFTNGLPYFRR